MSELVATPDAIRVYGDAAVAMATGVATAGAFDQVATVAAAAPVFGLIGQDFLMAFAYAQSNHASSMFELAGVHAGTALTAHQGAAAYEATEAASGTEFGAAGV
ncbi:type VII secretion target [Nocardia vinacea]|uniref:Type VII secretion target n=1 Tax=Nocardia vinacea TaxID=96468 RepID=A0ABZ1Z5I0_9NOCA|nr:type VII secretion target [Nocardia vinacea]